MKPSCFPLARGTVEMHKRLLLHPDKFIRDFAKYTRPDLSYVLVELEEEYEQRTHKQRRKRK